MVKPQRNISVSHFSLRFFKVFLPDQSSHSMKFPPAFSKNLKDAASFESTITNRARNSWKVDVEKFRDDFYFRKGWEQFVEHHSLEFGDFLVFSYNGNSIFRVKTYGQNGCEKDPIHQYEESCQVFSSPDENQTVGKRDSKGLDHVPIFGNFEDKYSDLKASEFVSNFPFFKVVMKPTHVYCWNMYVPVSFSKIHMRSKKPSVTLVHQDKSWLVTLNACKKFRRFSGGWYRFAKEHSLQEGDVCVFELIDRNKYVFNVSIFKHHL